MQHTNSNVSTEVTTNYTFLQPYKSISCSLQCFDVVSWATARVCARGSPHVISFVNNVDCADLQQATQAMAHDRRWESLAGSCVSQSVSRCESFSKVASVTTDRRSVALIVYNWACLLYLKYKTITSKTYDLTNHKHWPQPSAVWNGPSQASRSMWLTLPW